MVWGTVVSTSRADNTLDVNTLKENIPTKRQTGSPPSDDMCVVELE